MGDAAEDLRKAHELPEGDVIRILLEQHAQVKELFKQLTSASTTVDRQQTFDQLRTMLAVHETAEELILRPVSSKVAGQQVADARDQEEHEANKVLAELEKMDVDSPEFAEQIKAFEKAVSDHAEAEETQEFPQVLAQCDAEERQKMGKRLSAAEKVAPTHAHPSAAGSTAAQAVLGPFASIVDRTRDAIAKAGD